MRAQAAAQSLDSGDPWLLLRCCWRDHTGDGLNQPGRSINRTFGIFWKGVPCEFEGVTRLGKVIVGHAHKSRPSRRIESINGRAS